MKTYVDITRGLIFFSGLIAALCMLFPALTYEGTQYMGYEIIFGKEILSINPFNIGTLASVYMPFSTLAFLAYILPLIAGTMILFSKRLLFPSLIIFLLSTFLLALLPNTIKVLYVVGGSTNTLQVSWSIGVGLLGALIASSLGTISNLILLLRTSI